MCEVRVEPERFLAVGGVAWPGFQAFKLQAAWICIDVPIRVAMDRYRLRIWLEANQGWAIDGVATRWRRVKEELERQKLRMVANGMENGGSRGGWRTAWWQVDNGLANGVANGEWRGEWEMKTSTTEASGEGRVEKRQMVGRKSDCPATILGLPFTKFYALFTVWNTWQPNDKRATTQTHDVHGCPGVSK
jgi:hypothetical protein